jgi:arylsulfatase A-like enzyme
MKLPLLPLLLLLITSATPGVRAADRPNILWLTIEDTSPHLGCYGDTFARTPNLDALASRGQLFQRAWSNAPVCAPARTAIITGMYPSSTGGEHMRSLVALPSGVEMYPQILRRAGYYCTNNQKEDYNHPKPEGTWDESSKQAHWKNRAPNQPFFAIFNFTTTHESQNRKPNRQLISDPNQVPLPPFHPDTPEVRGDWVQCYDNIAVVDGQIQKQLDELAAAGLADDTIVFFFGDHGTGLPRFKRWPGSSGMRVPFIVHFPKKWQHLAPKGYAPGSQTDELISFVDLAPTLLSIVGEPIPAFMQGRPFCGTKPAPAPAYLHGFRSRMDERYDFMRSSTDGRYVYIRHYMPQVPYGLRLSYQSMMPTMQVWERMAQQNQLNPVQADFWKPKPVEALYDLQNDPWETVNLAFSPDHKNTLNRLRSAHQQHVIESRDLGFIPEAERVRVAAEKSPRDTYQEDAIYPIKEVLELASLATDNSHAVPLRFLSALEDPNPIVRYWAATGLLIRGPSCYAEAYPALKKALIDPNPSVRVVIAETVARHGETDDQQEALAVLLKLANVQQSDWFTAVEALNSIIALGERAAPIKAEIARLPQALKSTPKRLSDYVPRLVDTISNPSS